MSLENIDLNKTIDLRDNAQKRDKKSLKKENLIETGTVLTETHKIYKFPDNFLWGTSTSAYQVEGGIKNDWSEWEKSPTRKEFLEKKGEDPSEFQTGKFCDSYNRYEEDFDAAVDLGTNSIRFGVEWARIEPKKDTWNIEVIKHYREMLKNAKERGFVVVLTIWHWTNPVWIAKDGGWANSKTVDYYFRYAELVVKELGVYVDYFVTINEPMVHVANGYLSAKFPPNRRNPYLAFKAFNNLVKAHNKIYKIAHEYFPGAKVGITGLVNYIQPAHSWNPIEVLFAKIFHYFWNHLFFKKIKKNMDYVGVDYYFHDKIVWYPPFRKNDNLKINDMGWEIYPEGIYHVLKYLNKFGKPIFVMENGIPDAQDDKRSDFIKNHLFYVHKAIKDGVNVNGYFYWSLLDNFEWAAGWAPKFGLVAVDRKTGERKIKRSALAYKEICESNELKI